MKTIDAMASSAEFLVAEDLSIRVPSRLSPTTIFLGFRSMKDGQPELFPISGFPRYLVTEDSVTGEPQLDTVYLELN